MNETEREALLLEMLHDRRKAGDLDRYNLLVFDAVVAVVDEWIRMRVTPPRRPPEQAPEFSACCEEVAR